jgi:hypothetical protein
VVEGPDSDYVLRENGGYDRLYLGKAGGQPWYSHGFLALPLERRADQEEVVIPLNKGVTLRGSVVGPGGQPETQLRMFSPLQVGLTTHAVKIRGNRFELHGLDPVATYRVSFLDGTGAWGATLELSPKQAGDEPVTVHLAPCGSARVRFLDARGRPRTDFRPGLFLELAPERGILHELTFPVASPFRKDGPQTDATGRCTFSGLIPGATYRFGHAVIKTTFRTEAGKEVDLGDVAVKQP